LIASSSSSHELTQDEEDIGIGKAVDKKKKKKKKKKSSTKQQCG
jgi:hypothetical protein